MKTLCLLSLSCAFLLFAVFPASAQQWAVKDLTRVYFGAQTDDPVPADYAGDGYADPAIFRGSSGLWSVKDLTRVYLGNSTDTAVPSDYDGDSAADIAIFRPSSGLWSVQNVTRAFFGNSLDTPVSDQGGGDFDGDGTADLAVFRPSAGQWAIQGLPRVYLGSTGDQAVCHDYDGDGTTEVGIFRAGSSFWAVSGLTRFYFGASGDGAVSGDYDGDGTAEAGVFKGSSGLWAIRDLTRVYFGTSGNVTVPADYDNDGADEIAVYRSSYTAPQTIYQIQHDGLTGTQTVTGIVNLVYPNMGFFMAEASGAYHGIYINQTTYGPMIGDSVTLTGTVASSNGQTRLQSLTAFAINTRNNSPYAAAAIPTASITDEQYEGCLVSVSDAFTVSNQNSGSYKWVATGAGGSVTLGGGLDYNYFPRNGDAFTSFVGLVERNTSSSPNQWLQPRDTDDLYGPTSVIPHYALFGTVVPVDGTGTYYENHYLEVRGESIESIGPNPPAGVDVIDVDGLIFPGMISTHNHSTYDLFDFIPFSIPPYFRERNDWANDEYGGSMYCDFKKQWGGFSDFYDQITKLSEVRLATSGCTVNQGAGDGINHGDDAFAKLGVGIIDGQRFPGRCYDKVLGTTDGMEATWATKHQDAVNGKLHRYLAHLAETRDDGPTQATQWNIWKTYASFDGYDTLIHGMNIPAAEFSLFDHGLDAWGSPLKTVLSWACKSNMLLYDATANVQGALNAGATVALAPDWTESGMPNMLAELNYAAYVARDSGWSIQSRQFVEMVTRNAASGFGQLYRIGSLEEGKVANLMVIPDGDGDPFDDFMMAAGAGASYDYRCGPKDVKLTVVAGRPMYGDPDLLTTANFPFSYSGYLEDLTICGEAKKLSLARYDSGAYPGVNEKFLPFYLEMWNKYLRSTQYPCDFLSVDPAGALPPTPLATPTPPAGTFVITAGTDDASEHVSNYVDNASYVYLGRHTVSDGYYFGARFNNVNIPNGATVNSAYLVLTQHDTYNTNQPVLLVAAHDTDNSPTFSSSNGPLDRGNQLTSAQVAWTPSAGTPGVEFQSPNIASVLQEVVNRAGWVSGNSLSVIVKDNEAAVDHRRRAWAYDGDPALAPRLVVDFETGPTPPPTPTVTPTPFGFKTPTPPPTATPVPTATPTPEGYKTPIPTPLPDNLLLNPGFETWNGTSFASWTQDASSTYTVETGTVHSGSNSAKVTTTVDPGAYGKGFYQDVPVTVGETYEFSAWLWSLQTGSMGITVSWFDGVSPKYWDTPTSTAAGQWQQFSVQSTAPAGTISARAWIRGFLNTAPCGYGDDAQFRVVDP